MGLIKNNAVVEGGLIVFIGNVKFYWFFMVPSLVMFITLRAVAPMLTHIHTHTHKHTHTHTHTHIYIYIYIYMYT